MEDGLNALELNRKVQSCTGVASRSPERESRDHTPRLGGCKRCRTRRPRYVKSQTRSSVDEKYSDPYSGTDLPALELDSRASPGSGISEKLPKREADLVPALQCLHIARLRYP